MPPGGEDIRVSEGALQQVDLGAPVHGVARVGVPEPLRRDLRGILETRLPLRSPVLFDVLRVAEGAVVFHGYTDVPDLA
jgi:hypothetical protein